MTFRAHASEQHRQSRFGGDVPFHEHEASDLVGGTFGQVRVAGDIYSDNWDGANPADLGAGEDATATQGFYLDASAGVIQAQNYFGDSPDVPTGVITMYGGTTAPSTWLLCRGQQVPQTTYADLFGVIGTYYNTGGETAGYFRVPDLQQRFPMGKHPTVAETGYTLGETGGLVDTTAASDSLSEHDHSEGTLAVTNSNESSHTHSFSGTSSGPSSSLEIGTGTGGGTRATNTHTHTVSGTTGSGSSHTHTATINGRTGGGAGTQHQHTTNPPYLVVNFIIKT